VPSTISQTASHVNDHVSAFSAQSTAAVLRAERRSGDCATLVESMRVFLSFPLGVRDLGEEVSIGLRGQGQNAVLCRN
jgi:hypothetical protein